MAIDCAALCGMQLRLQFRQCASREENTQARDVQSHCQPMKKRLTQRNLVFQVRVKLDSGPIHVDEREIALTPGMAVTAEIATSRRRVIEFFLDPIRKTLNEGLRER